MRLKGYCAKPSATHPAPDTRSGATLRETANNSDEDWAVSEQWRRRHFLPREAERKVHRKARPVQPGKGGLLLSGPRERGVDRRAGLPWPNEHNSGFSRLFLPCADLHTLPCSAVTSTHPA